MCNKSTHNNGKTGSKKYFLEYKSNSVLLDGLISKSIL